MKTKLILLLVIALWIFAGCEDKDNTTGPLPLPETPVYVLNEGNYGNNNSTLTVYDRENEEVSHNVFYNVNGARLGDTGNDMVIHNDKIYVVLSVSKKIEVLQIPGYESVGSIDLGESEPRQMEIIGDNAGYVTCFGTDDVVKFDPETLTITKRIKTGASPEGITFAGGKLFVANSGLGSGNTVSIIYPTSDEEVKKLEVGLNPQPVVAADDNVFVVCAGTYSGEVSGSLVKIEPLSEKVMDSVAIGGFPWKAAPFTENKILVINGSGISSYNTRDLSLDVKNLIPVDAVNSFDYPSVNSVAYDDVEKVIFVANPKDFQQNGEIVMFDEQGEKTGSFAAGLIPGTICITR